MESRGGLGIWKGHIWGPPPRVFTFQDKWGHWVAVSREWAPSAHTDFLNAHQNNLSKPRDTFLRCLMWGQIGNHFNKIPLGWNCISQKSKHRGETQGTPTVRALPDDCVNTQGFTRWQLYSGRTCRLGQKGDWVNARAGIFVVTKLIRIAPVSTQQQVKSCEGRPILMTQYQTSPSPIFSFPSPQPLPFTNTHEKASHFTTTSPHHVIIQSSENIYF